MESYKAYYDMVMNLPILKELVKQNRKLKKQNSKLKHKNKALKSILYEVHSVRSPASKIKEICKIKKEFDNVDDNDSDVVFVEQTSKPNIVYDLIDDDELNQSFDEDDEDAQAIVNDLKNELKSENITVKKLNVIETEIEEEEEVEEEEEEEEEVEEEEEEEVEEAEEEEEVEEEEDEEAEEEEEEAQEEEEEAQEEEVEEEEEQPQEEEEGASGGTIGSPEEEEEEVEEVLIKGKAYYTTNKLNGAIYEKTGDEDIGDEIGVFKDGKAIFHKKK
jgi:hypothetical protein